MDLSIRRPAMIAALAAAAALAGCSTDSRKAAVSIDSADVRLAVNGAANGNVSVAASGADVTVAWAATAEGATNIYAASSRDNGVTFGAPVRVNDLDADARVSGEQPPRVAIGREVDVVWTSRRGGQAQVRLARSTDRGRTFGPAVSLQALDVTGTRGWASLAVDASGGVHALWLDGRDSPPMQMPTTGGVHAMHGSARQDVYQAAWRPDGTTSEVRIAENACFCCKTSVSVSPDGTVFAAWRHIYPTNIRDMAVARSTDGGRTFGPPVRVSEDHWQIDACPEDGPSTAVGADGVLDIAWPTLLPAADARKAIFYSYSTDGGRTFVPRIRVDDERAIGTPAHPQVVRHGGRAAIVWDQSADGRHVIRMRDVPAAGGPAAPGPIVTLGADGSAIYPSIAATGDAAVIAWTATTTAGTEIRVRRLPW